MSLYRLLVSFSAPQNAIDCARLTGQTQYTVEVFRPLRNIYNRVRDFTRASTTAVGLAWMSKYIYQYHRLMLMNLSPREPATIGWPLYLYPPPHLLVGYQYVVRVCNDYVFDVRSYSRLKYTEIHLPLQQKLNWTVMANCSYTINTGAYHRFIDLENFEETLTQIQQAILAERVVADLALIRPMRGYGVTSVAGDSSQLPVEGLLHTQYKDLSQCQNQAWGLADRLRIQQAGNKDVVLLTTIRKLKTAFFNFLITPRDSNTMLSLPCDCMWLDAFVQKFSSEDPEFQSIRSLPSLTVTKSIISALSLPRPSPCTPLSGGAFELRPRENGRAVTEEMRRRRGEMIEQFVDRLPVRRRRRRATPPPPEADIEEPSPPRRSFEEEVRETVAQVIQLLQEELTVSAQNEQFFNFAVDFYEVIQRLEMLGNVNELTIRRWVMYFFVVEHIATTLNYLHHNLRMYPPSARWLDLELAQVVMRARDDEGRVVYSRVWNEMGENAFSQVMSRVSGDLAATVERAGLGELEEEEVEQFMADISYQDNSGDVSEILRQAAVNDAEVDSMELSFRFKVTGPVVFSQNRQIQIINQRVVALASQLRLNHRPLPAHHDHVQLP
ncbi:DNA terminal protein [Bat mastadenovirus]|uniref:Preterminal protein n=1 Tax=Bat mastadenovirus TaxID=740971 RepID=A0A3G9EY06_9ADEN|nr:DNA terminal protein [Bat mastadenovirus]BBE29305.1 DNA terminal protein [Bat mastadenovirus]